MPNLPFSGTPMEINLYFSNFRRTKKHRNEFIPPFMIFRRCIVVIRKFSFCPLNVKRVLIWTNTMKQQYVNSYPNKFIWFCYFTLSLGVNKQYIYLHRKQCFFFFLKHINICMNWNCQSPCLYPIEGLIFLWKRFQV